MVVVALTSGLDMVACGPRMINVLPSILNNHNISNEMIHVLQAGKLGNIVFIANLDYKDGWKKLKKVFSMAGVLSRR